MSVLEKMVNHELYFLEGSKAWLDLNIGKIQQKYHHFFLDYHAMKRKHLDTVNR